MAIDDSDLLKKFSDVLKPDRRVIFWGGGVENNFQAFYSEISKMQLNEHVPEDVVIQFETAKNVLLYSFYAYRMSTVAKSYAYSVFEKALVEKIRIELRDLSPDKTEASLPKGLKNKLKFALDKGWLIKNDFFYLRNEQISRSQELLDAIYEFFINRRNDLSHEPWELDILWRVPEDISIFAHLINKLYSK